VTIFHVVRLCSDAIGREICLESRRGVQKVAPFAEAGQMIEGFRARSRTDDCANFGIGLRTRYSCCYRYRRRSDPFLIPRVSKLPGGVLRRSPLKEHSDAQVFSSLADMAFISMSLVSSSFAGEPSKQSGMWRLNRHGRSRRSIRT
jgi:hypothetical protein